MIDVDHSQFLNTMYNDRGHGGASGNRIIEEEESINESESNQFGSEKIDNVMNNISGKNKLMTG